MAEIRRLDGSVLDAAKPERNERIATLLDKLIAENDAGRLSAIVAVSMTPSTEHRVQWALPEQDFGYPWGLALRGALVLAQHAMGRADIPAPQKPDLPDGA